MEGPKKYMTPSPPRLPNGKRCTSCKRVVPIEEFKAQRAARDGLHSWCSECSTIRKHGITYERFSQMMESQGGQCGLCCLPLGGRGRQWQCWVIDHDHEHCPGTWGCADCVRGLIHRHCNLLLSPIEDTVFLAQALAYLDGFRKVDHGTNAS